MFFRPKVPKRGYEFTPQRDITAFELADILHVIVRDRFSRDLEKQLAELSDECRRHFTPLRCD